MSSVESRILETLSKYGTISKDQLLKVVFKTISISAMAGFESTINRLAEKKTITINKNQIQLHD